MYLCNAIVLIFYCQLDATIPGFKKEARFLCKLWLPGHLQPFWASVNCTWESAYITLSDLTMNVLHCIYVCLICILILVTLYEPQIRVHCLECGIHFWYRVMSSLTSTSVVREDQTKVSFHLHAGLAHLPFKTDVHPGSATIGPFVVFSGVEAWHKSINFVPKTPLADFKDLCARGANARLRREFQH